MPKEPLMELADNKAFDFTVLGVDYVAYHLDANALFQGKTKIYDLDESDEDPVLLLSGIFDQKACECAMIGFKTGIKVGMEIGEKSVKRAFQQLLNLPSLEDVEALDSRMDRVARGAAR